MRRIILVLALALMLCATAWNPGFSRVTPWDYQDPAIDHGEDHPWGGEQSYTPPTQIYGAGPDNGTVNATGFFLIDFWFGHLFDMMDYYDGESVDDQRVTEPLTHERTGSTTITKGN